MGASCGECQVGMVDWAWMEGEIKVEKLSDWVV